MVVRIRVHWFGFGVPAAALSLSPGQAVRLAGWLRWPLAWLFLGGIMDGALAPDVFEVWGARIAV